MQRSGTLYTIFFSAIICVVCSILVSSAAVALKPIQEVSMKLDRQKSILEAAGLRKPGEKLSKDQVLGLFEKHVKPVVINLKTGEPTGDDPESFDPAKEFAKKETSQAAPANLGGVSRIPNRTIVYEVTGQGGEVEMVVLPIQGKGLWSTIYGFLALDKDGRTIRGITFYQHGETPGLGGEIDNPKWKGLWPNRKAYDENGEPAIAVIKGDAGDSETDPYKIDGISGATITGRGVSNFVQFWLGENGFRTFVERFSQQRS